MAWGSWTRWRAVCVVSAAEGWPLLRASSERRAWGRVSCWPSVSCCLNTTRQGSADDYSVDYVYPSFIFWAVCNKIFHGWSQIQKWKSSPLLCLSHSSACNTTNLSGQDADFWVSPGLASSSSSFSLISTLKWSSQSRITVCARASKVSKSPAFKGLIFCSWGILSV